MRCNPVSTATDTGACGPPGMHSERSRNVGTTEVHFGITHICGCLGRNPELPLRHQQPIRRRIVPLSIVARDDHGKTREIPAVASVLRATRRVAVVNTPSRRPALTSSSSKAGMPGNGLYRCLRYGRRGFVGSTSVMRRLASLWGSHKRGLRSASSRRGPSFVRAEGGVLRRRRGAQVRERLGESSAACTSRAPRKKLTSRQRSQHRVSFSPSRVGQAWRNLHVVRRPHD